MLSISEQEERKTWNTNRLEQKKNLTSFVKILNWLFNKHTGQSNMEMPLRGWPPNDIINNSKEEIEKSWQHGKYISL